MASRVPGQGRRVGLRGRAGECALLDGVVEDIRRGESRALVVRGEPGIGKTVLLEYLVASASDLMVVQAVGVESEMELAYASLHQVCAPLLDGLERIPAPQRQALEIVFGMAEGAAPDRFLVGLAVLSLFSEMAEERPLLCVVDDAHWLDQASALTLAFVARRLLAEPVGIVFAAREPGDELQRLPQLDVPGLRNGDARALLRSALRFMLDEQVRDRIIAETRGNPLALLELPRGLTATQLAGGFGLLGAQALAGRIEKSFVRQVEALSGDVRKLLLIAAAEPLGDPLLLMRASERLGIAVPLIDAPTDGLLAVGDRVTFRHPLVRSAVYRSAAEHERRMVHLALADATDRESDPDRRAWHLASAASGPDEQVALELERSASRAQARGGLAAAAAFLQRAVELTEDPARRADRALAAAQASLQAGAFDAALGLLAAADAVAHDDFQRSRADLLRGQVAFISFRGRDAPMLLLAAAQRLEPFDLKLARETYLTALGATLMAGHLAQPGTLVEICRAVQACPWSGVSRPVDLLLDGQTLLHTEGHAAATPTLQRAATALADISVEDVLRWGWIAPSASALVWDLESMRAICAREVRLLRDAGALAALPSALETLALATSWMGDFAETASLASESESVATAIASGHAAYARLRLGALTGNESEVSALVASAVGAARPVGQGMARNWAQWSTAVLYNGLARYGEAVSAARQATSEKVDPTVAMWALPELVEAAKRGGHGELTHDAVERLAETTQPCGTDHALGIEARCRALLTDGADADELYREAVERLSRTTIRTELARAYLLYGEWLRRENRRPDARVQLRAAYDLFTSIGMNAFAERARGELQGTGENVRRLTVETRDELTTQERQISRLARDGLSNPEIGARLFLSPRTVEWHLRNVFVKLGIRSRRELPGALQNTDSHVV